MSEIEFTEKFQCFLSAWTGALSMRADNMEHQKMPVSQFSAQLLKFIQACGRLPSDEALSESARAPLDPLALEAFIETFKPALSRVQSTGAMANVWSVAGLDRNEIRIAGVLSWFLDCQGDHGQSYYLCEMVIDQIQRNIGCMPDNYRFNKFPTSAQLLDSKGCGRYRANTEVCPLGEQENRVDIEISSPELLLFIEVKIDAPQGASQLARYQRIAEQNAEGRHWGVVYLTSPGGLPDDARELPNIASLTWSDVARCFRDRTEILPRRTPARRYIEQFADFIVDL